MVQILGLTREGGDIMTQINSNPDPIRRLEQSNIIIEEEMLACERVICRPDLTSLLAALHDSRIRLAISTKNCELAVLKFFEIADIPANRFDPLLTRDSLEGLSKPDPRVAEHILKVSRLLFCDLVWCGSRCVSRSRSICLTDLTIAIPLPIS